MLIELRANPPKLWYALTPLCKILYIYNKSPSAVTSDRSGDV